MTASIKFYSLLKVFVFYLIFSYSEPVFCADLSDKTLADIATTGEVEHNNPGWKKFLTRLRVRAWNFVVDKAASHISEQTETLLLDPEVGFSPYIYPDIEINPELRPMSDLDWAKYDLRQNCVGINLKKQGTRTLDDEGREGISIPANIVIPLSERSWADTAQNRIARVFHNYLTLKWESLGPIPGDLKRFRALQDQHIDGRVEKPNPPAALLAEYQKGNLGSYLPELFRHGPFAGSIRYEGDGKIVYRSLPQAATKNPELYHRLDTEVQMHYDIPSDKLVVDSIKILRDFEGDAWQEIHPGDSLFLIAQRVVGANLNNFTTIREHLGICHLKVAQVLADAVKILPEHHPLRIFLGRFVYRTDIVNGNVGLLVGSDVAQVAAVKSYHSNMLKKMLSDLDATFNIREADPRTHAVDQHFYREVVGPQNQVSYVPQEIFDPVHQIYAVMPYPTLEQSIQLFEIFLEGANAAIASLTREEFSQMRPWYERINASIRGVEAYGAFSEETIAKLMAIFMHNGSVRHELKSGIAWHVTSLLPAFPTTINRGNLGGLPHYEDMLGADYIVLATKGKLPRLEATLKNGKIIFSSIHRETQREQLIRCYRNMFHAFKNYDAGLDIQRRNKPHPFDLLFRNLDASVGI